MIKFKHPNLYQELVTNGVRRDVRTALLLLSTFMDIKYEQDIVVTSVLGGDVPDRKSKTHEEGRAVDIRTKDWPEGAALLATDWINGHLQTGAYSMEIAVYHDVGYGEHIHLQVAHRPMKIILSDESYMLL